jgi:NTP pyrophosphatase (non-canonical NTP hydrolase)
MWWMQRHVAEFDAQRFQSLGPGYVALNIAGEAGELANVMKKIWRTDPRIAKPEGYQAIASDQRTLIADEIADVMMLTLVLANHLGIDVEAEVQRKLDVIDERLRQGHYGHEAKRDDS